MIQITGSKKAKLPQMVLGYGSSNDRCLKYVILSYSLRFFFLHTCSDPMQSILSSLEQQHEEEKRSALERQRLMYEHELEQLRRRLSPERQNCRGVDRLSFHSPSAQQRLKQWAEER